MEAALVDLRKGVVGCRIGHDAFWPRARIDVGICIGEQLLLADRRIIENAANLACGCGEADGSGAGKSDTNHSRTSKVGPGERIDCCAGCNVRDRAPPSRCGHANGA